MAQAETKSMTDSEWARAFLLANLLDIGKKLGPTINILAEKLKSARLEVAEDIANTLREPDQWWLNGYIKQLQAGKLPPISVPAFNKRMSERNGGNPGEEVGGSSKEGIPDSGGDDDGKAQS
jgi:hypothetical protein